MSFAFGVAVGVAAVIIIKLSDPECRQRSCRTNENVWEAIEKKNDQPIETQIKKAQSDVSNNLASKHVVKVDEFQPRQYCILLKSE